MENEEVDLKQLLNMFWNKKKIIILITLIAALLGYGYTMYWLKPKYTATATLILAQKDTTSSSTSVTSTDVTLNDKLIATYKELAKSTSVVREVLDNLKITDMTEEMLKSEINVTAVTSTQILKISVTDLNADKATKITNELTKVFSNKVIEIYKIDNISIVDKAEKPTSPSNENHTKDIAMFAAGGLILSIGIVFLMNMLKNTIDNERDIESTTGLLMLAELPDCEFSKKKSGGRR